MQIKPVRTGFKTLESVAYTLALNVYDAFTH